MLHMPDEIIDNIISFICPNRFQIATVKLTLLWQPIFFVKSQVLVLIRNSYAMHYVGDWHRARGLYELGMRRNEYEMVSLNRFLRISSGM